MKTATVGKCVMAVLVFLLLTSLTVQAEEGEGGDRSRVREPGERIKALDLSPEKEAQVLEIVKTHRQAMANFRGEHAEELKALREQMKAAREAEDKDKMQALREQMKELFGGRKEQFENLKSQLSDVLSDEEVGKVLKLMRLGRQAGQRGQRSARLGLDDDQKAKVKAILAEAKEQAKAAETREEKHKIIKAAREKIHSEVLTAEQKAKADKFREHREKNKLTEDQKSQIKAILAEAKEKAKAAETREEKREIMKAARKKIHGEVLTEQQRKRAKRFGGPGRHGGRMGGRMGGRGHGGRGKPEGSDE